ncbi:MAG: histone deacetylase [Elusimicrobiota bacterium]|nr:histone deacetylase [Elusimicrobiota bacterium]
MGRVFSDLKTTQYGASGHPEAPFRVRDSFALLKAAGLVPELPPVTASAADVERLHPKDRLAVIASGGYDDADTPPYAGMDAISMISLSGALSAAESAKAGTPAFSLMRPPGHHAGKDRVAGFCYLNNAALAVARLQEKTPGLKVGIVDFDVHHGDGTEELVLGRENVTFLSLHQFPLYPGSGGASRGNCKNVPLPAGTDGDRYIKEYEPALERLLATKPDLLAVSAGFDAYKDDPIAGLKLDETAFRRVGSLLAQTKLPRFAVLEGGYSRDLPYLVEAFLEGFF